MNSYRLLKAAAPLRRLHPASLTVILAACLFSPSMKADEEDLSKKEPFYVNGATIYINPEPDDDKATGVTPVSEGIWGRQFPDGFQFYDTRGIKFTDSRWDLPGTTATPKMTQWGMMVTKSGDPQPQPYYLLKPDGSATRCPAEWIYPTKFVDGLAIVGIRENYKINYKYITPDLKIAFPNLSPSAERFEDKESTTPPLSEGLRAYATKVDYNTLWGYIDEKGNIVIEPQFREARSFHCGLALVKDLEGNQFFIDKQGKKAYEPQWGKYDDVSDYDSGICSAPGGKFNETDYYDLHGQKIKTLKRGSPFHDGYAFCFEYHEDLNKDLVHRVGKDFTILEAVGVTTADFNPPTYDEKGIAHFTRWMVDNGPCNGEYFFDYSIGPFSKEGLAPATMVTNDGKTVYKGFIDTAGHFVLVYSKQTK